MSEPGSPHPHPGTLRTEWQLVWPQQPPQQCWASGHSREPRSLWLMPESCGVGGCVTGHVAGGLAPPSRRGSCSHQVAVPPGAWLPPVSIPGGLRPKLGCHPLSLWALGTRGGTRGLQCLAQTAKSLSHSYLRARVSLWGSLPQRLPWDPFHMHVSLSAASLGLRVSLPAFLPTPISLSHSLSCHTLQSLYPSWLPYALQTGPGPHPAPGDAPGPRPVRPEGGPRTQELSSGLS